MSETTAVADPPRARDVLTRSEATARAQRVERVEYQVSLYLPGGSPSYRGSAVLEFEAAGDGPLFIDFRGREVERLEVNGALVDAVDWNGFRLILPGEVVEPRMRVRIDYVNDFDTGGDGFHRFVDPEDGAEYVYTNFEPYEAHRLFPCFDQPDIKGHYTFVVEAPRGWTLIANAPVEAREEEGERLRHRFARTELFSTYLVALIGGEYVERRTDHGGLSLGLFARRSMERHLDEHAAEIFEITSQGLDFFSQLFDQPYPFAKYDQIFVPEYNSGAMENVAAVTYNEAYLFREPPTESQRLDRAEVLLHELAHMWFGDLATMRWWDDLWLNESFATYISYLAMVEATRFTNAWKVFNSDIKRWAYQQDQLVTTHPISADAEDTEVAFLNFDGITYGKGAAVLKQLVQTVGRDGFRDGIRLYFRRYAWANATLRDFLACLADASGHSLDEWSRLWLETASLNTLAADWQADAGTISRLALRQSAPADYPTLRPHALEVGLGEERDGHLVVSSLPATIDGAVTAVDAAVGRPVPQLVFPNHADHAYAKVALDRQTLEYVTRHLDRIDDALLRQLLWMSLWEMVRDTQLSATQFLAIARAHLDAEPDHDIVGSVIERVNLTLGRYLPDSARPREAHDFFETALRNLRAADSNDAQIIWARAVIAAAQSPDDVQAMLELVDGRQPVAGFEFDQEMRWEAAIKSAAFGLAGADERIAAEQRRDRSDRGQRAVIRAGAARPTPEAKEEAWRRIHGEGYGSFHFTRAAMLGFTWNHQAALLAPYVERFFDEVRGVFETRDHPFARAYVLSLYPAHTADPVVVERTHALLGSLNGGLPTLSRQLAEAGDELDRQIRVRRHAEA